MQLRTTHRLVITGLVTTTLGAAACGDNGEPQGRRPDAGEATPDADVEATPTRAATIAVADGKVTTTGGAAIGLRGLAVTVEFTDLTVSSPAPVFGTGAIGSCTVYKYTVGTDAPPPSADEGDVTISGDGLGAATHKPMVCALNTALTPDEYECPIDSGTATTGGVIASLGGGQFSVDINGENDTGGGWPGTYRGAYLRIAGTGLPQWDRDHPIVAIMPTFAVVVNPVGTAIPDLPTTTTFTVLGGNGPIPAGAATDFLDVEGDDDVTIDMPASTAYPMGINFDLEPIGNGMTLGGTQPHQFPTTATAVTFSCAAADGGNCGSNPTTADIKGVIVTGNTTSGSVASLPDYFMPATANGNEYTTFRCSFIGAESGTIPADAVAAILDTTPPPTRIETRVFRVNGVATAQGPDASNTLNVLVGNALVGHTTLP